MNKTFCGDGPTDKTNISKIKNQLGKNSETGRLMLKYLILIVYFEMKLSYSYLCSCRFLITINKLPVTVDLHFWRKNKKLRNKWHSILANIRISKKKKHKKTAQFVLLTFLLTVTISSYCINLKRYEKWQTFCFENPFTDNDKYMTISSYCINLKI